MTKPLFFIFAPLNSDYTEYLKSNKHNHEHNQQINCSLIKTWHMDKKR